jgi:hypothetical protein
MIESLDCSPDLDKIFVGEHTGKIGNGVSIGNGIFEIERNKIPIVIRNSNYFPITIHKDKEIAVAEGAELIEVPVNSFKRSK